MDLFAWCVRLSRFKVGLRTRLKSLHFHSFVLRWISLVSRVNEFVEICGYVIFHRCFG